MDPRGYSHAANVRAVPVRVLRLNFRGGLGTTSVEAPSFSDSLCLLPSPNLHQADAVAESKFTNRKELFQKITCNR